MNFSVPAEKLREHKLFVATPMFGGQCSGKFMMSCLALQKKLSDVGIDHSFVIRCNESLIQRARNKLVYEFLKGDWTHLLFIDSDIVFEAQDVLFLLALNRDVIGAPYAKKSINWESIRQALAKDPETPAEDLDAIASRAVLGFMRDGTVRLDEPVEVRELGTGFLMIKREVFEKMAKQYPISYELMEDEGSGTMEAFFECGTFNGNKNYLSEDYLFCHRWTAMGGQVWVCPWMKTTHIGPHEFVSDIATSARYLASIS